MNSTEPPALLPLNGIQTRRFLVAAGGLWERGAIAKVIGISARTVHVHLKAGLEPIIPYGPPCRPPLYTGNDLIGMYEDGERWAHAAALGRFITQWQPVAVALQDVVTLDRGCIPLDTVLSYEEPEIVTLKGDP